MRDDASSQFDSIDLIIIIIIIMDKRDASRNVSFIAETIIRYIVYACAVYCVPVSKTLMTTSIFAFSISSSSSSSISQI